MTPQNWFLGLAALIAAVPAAESGQGAVRSALAGYVFEKIADTSTSIPGGTGTFEKLGVPSIGGGTIAFRGDGLDGQQGVYAWTDGVLRRIADRNTPVPGASGTFTRFENPDFDGEVSVSSEGTVAFAAGFPLERGVYTNATGPLTALVEPNSPVPGRPLGVFENIFFIAHDGGQVAFSAISTDFHQGVYLADETSISLVADQTTPIPGGKGTFTDFGLSSSSGAPSLSAGDVVFVSRGNLDDAGRRQSGVYGLLGGTLVVIADENTRVPGGAGAKFSPFGAPADIHQGTVVFENGNDGGIFRAAAGSLEKVADRRTRMPGSPFRFSAFGPPAVDHGAVAFGGQFHFYYPPDNPYAIQIVLRVGLYSDLFGALDVVADSSRASRPSRQRFKAVRSGTEALSDGRFVFRLTLRDDAEVIYLARPVE